MKFWILLTCCYVLCGSMSVSNEPTDDYYELNKFAKLTSIAYCLKKGLKIGKLGSENSYCPLEACRNEFQEVEIVEIIRSKNREEDATGYIALDHLSRSLIVVFRGTSSRRDWLRDVDIIPVPYTPLVILNEMLKFQENELFDNCKVHRGFYQMLQEIFPLLIQKIEELFNEYNDYSLVISGHSLGAALTLLVGIECKLLGYDPLVVNFAGPKVGNSNFAQFADDIFNVSDVAQRIASEGRFDKGYIRVEHKNDLVPLLPPLSTYQHCGYKYFIIKKELPHPFSSLEHEGLSSDNNMVDCDEDPYEVNNLRISSNLWMEHLNKYEHTHYFVPITGCKEHKD